LLIFIFCTEYIDIDLRSWIWIIPVQVSVDWTVMGQSQLSCFEGTLQERLMGTDYSSNEYSVVARG